MLDRASFFSYYLSKKNHKTLFFFGRKFAWCNGACGLWMGPSVADLAAHCVVAHTVATPIVHEHRHHISASRVRVHRVVRKFVPHYSHRACVHAVTSLRTGTCCCLHTTTHAQKAVIGHPRWRQKAASLSIVSIHLDRACEVVINSVSELTSFDESLTGVCEGCMPVVTPMGAKTWSM
jgi:hypothetical protein